MAKEVYGLMACPECGFEDAQVKRTKGGLYYRFCPDCSAQYFPRSEDTSARLFARCRPVTVTGTEAPAQGEATETPATPATVQDKKPAQVPAKKPAGKPAFDMGL